MKSTFIKALLSIMAACALAAPTPIAAHGMVSTGDLSLFASHPLRSIIEADGHDLPLAGCVLSLTFLDHRPEEMSHHQVKKLVGAGA
jgi:hypothetical protein